MKAFKSLIFISFLVFSVICFGFPIKTKSPVFKSDRPTPGKINKVPNKAKSKKRLDIGPGQPEVQTFKPADASNLVDLFSGDFSYNIPLLDVGGYPVNIFYTSNIGMEDEASWVGLGFNLNSGAISRNVRGLPDDFSGEAITKTFNIKKHETFGGTTGVDFELYGFGISASLGIKHNNYTGIGLDLGAGVSYAYSAANGLNAGVSANLGLSSDAGASISPSVNLGYSMMDDAERSRSGNKLGIAAGMTWNSLDGLGAMYIAPSFTRTNNNLKNFQADYTLSQSFPLTFARQTYTPSLTMPTKNLSLNFRLKIGGEIQGGRLAGSISAFYNSQTLEEKSRKSPAYGYLYAHNGKDDINALHDFNREKDGPFEIQHPELPVLNPTYDVYTVTGHGVSGNFRPFRNDIGTVSDPAIEVVSNGGGLGVDVAAGLIAKIGADIEFSESKTYTGKWTSSSNESKDQLQFRRKSDVAEVRYEPAYFKNVGEKNVLVNENFYNLIGKREPIAIKLEGDMNVKAKPTMLAGNTSTALTNANTVKNQREQRNINFQYLTVEEAQYLANQRLIKVYTGNSDGDTVLLERKSRNNDSIGGKQISQIIILNDDGTRYVYGLPAYNFKKQEVSFNISNGIPRATTDSISMMSYNPGDNTSNNNKGTNHYFNEVETPPYAYAYYITEILSADYVDILGDGPTGDDLGTFTKFTYYRDSLYRWRSPHQQNKAFFNAGNLYDQKDDMGSYQYGEKEVFYLRTIETRNHIAVFSLSDRKDAYGVLGKDGGIDFNSKLKKLQSIALYTKSAYLKNIKIPVKKVNFEYDYSLCRKNPSSEADSGKLTLKRVYLTYQRSGKGKRHAYNFRYDGMNPQYAVGASDRWGTYKAIKKRTPASGGGITEQNRSIANNEFPYTDQDFRKIQADSFASAWALTSVKTPEGATIKVYYEADDYAFVQDRRAMQLLQVLGFSSTPNGSVSANLYTGIMPNNYLHFRTAQPVTTTSAQELLKGINEFYFTARVNITGPGSSFFGEKLFEPVDGFFLLNNTSIVVIDSQHVVVEIKPEGNYHAFSLATLKRIKSEYPGVAYEFPQISENVLDDIANAFAGLVRSAGDLISGGLFNRMRGEGVTSEIIPGKSFVRMNVPDYFKIGGGSRVKRIEISDEWKSMSSTRDSTKNYSSEYDYTRIGDNNRIISSGVAAYEPPQGGNESPFLLPEYYNVSKKFSFMGIDLFEVENERKYVIGQYGESFFPGASVGYSQVTVKNNTDPQIKKHSTGRSVYTFYTAYDFPTIYQKTPTEVKKFKQFLPFLIYNSNVDRVAASQGYYFEMNDMHGKAKSMFDYSTKDSVNPISGKTYYYRASNKTLVNDAKVIDREGNISEAEIGVETDILADERESSTYVKGPSVDINVDIILIGIFPIPIPVPVPKYSTEDILFRSTCLTKVSQRSGLIDSIVSFDGAARIVSRPLLYDAVTGKEVLLSVNNEFSDYIYTLTIPSHWVHEGMGPAFYNHGLEIASIQVDANSSIVTIPQAERLLFPGDEVFLVSGSNRVNGWVLQVKGDQVIIIDAIGNKIPGSLNGASLKVIRSGRRNMHSISIGQIVSKQNPVAGMRLAVNAAKEVINSSAQEYSENWQTYAAFKVYPKKLTCNCATGVKTKNSNAEGFATTLLSAIVANWQQGDSLYGWFYKLSIPRVHLQQYFNLNADSVCYNLERSGKEITINFFDCSNQKRICGAKLETNWLGELQFFTGKVSVSADIDGVSVDGCNDNGFRVAGNTFSSIKGQFECLALRRCALTYTTSDESQLCAIPPGDSIVNPYRLGLLGIYRPRRSLLYLTDRTTGPVRTAGVYSNYEPFWTSKAITNAQPSNWTWTEQTTMIDPYGKVLELKDTLGRYRAELYGFDYNLVVASAKNARYQQIAFMSFEDFDFKNTSNSTCWLPPHFDFNTNADSLITEDVSHTGRRSLQFRNNFDYSITRTAAPVVSAPSFINANGEYRMTNHELIGTFNPSEGDYYIEAWINMNNAGLLSYHGLAELEVIIDSRDTLYFRPFGAIVDGWQKIGGRFSLLQGYNNIKFRFINRSPVAGFLDDIRVHPFHASMETYVYDPLNLKLMSTLDDNNFATIYEYDEEGMLTRIKKETYQGVLTVQEVRAGKPKQN